MKNLLQVFKTGESLRKRMMKIENSGGYVFCNLYCYDCNGGNWFFCLIQEKGLRKEESSCLSAGC